MYKINEKKIFAENVVEYVIEAPLVAKRCLPGQFVILRVDGDGERVPFTIADYDREKGTVSMLVQTVGLTTMKLAALNAGDYISDFVGPLGNATELSAFKRLLLVAGGIGAAVILPQAKYLKLSTDKKADVILGGRNTGLLIYRSELKAYSDNFYIMTDDGSEGEKGFVTDKIRKLLDSGEKYDTVFAVGPLPMMRAVAELTRGYGVHTIVSMNSMMVDGTGMCGCCRLSVGGKVKYACVDGPEFDGHLVDFSEAINRSAIYKEREKEHVCRLSARNVGGK